MSEAHEKESSRVAGKATQALDAANEVGSARLARVAAIVDQAERNPRDGTNLTGLSRQQRRELLAGAPRIHIPVEERF